MTPPKAEPDWDQIIPGIVALMKFAETMAQERTASEVWRFALRGNDEAATRRVRDLSDEYLTAVADAARTVSVLARAALKSREQKS